MRGVWITLACVWLAGCAYVTLRIDDVIPEQGNPYQAFFLTHEFHADDH